VAEKWTFKTLSVRTIDARRADVHLRHRHPVAGGGDTHEFSIVGAGTRPARRYSVPLGHQHLDLELGIGS